MSKILSRRSTLKILASAIAMTPFYTAANKSLYSYSWQSSALGNQVDMQIFTKNKNHLEKLIILIDSEINRFNKIFYLQDASSKINLLNKHKVKIKSFPKDVTNAMFKAASEILIEKSKENEFTKKVYDSWSSYWTKATKLSNLTELGYMNLRSNYKQKTET